MSANYYIILLKDGLALVPSSWITVDNKLCYWPNKYTKSRVDTAIRNKEPPQVSRDWSLFTITKIYGSADNFEQGLLKLKKCEYISDLESGNTSADEDRDEDLLKETRHNRASRKDATKYDELDSSTSTQEHCIKSTNLCTPKNNMSSSHKSKCTTLSSFPDPPTSLTIINENVDLDDKISSANREGQQEKPVIVATFDSPVINGRLLVKNQYSVSTPLVDNPDYLMEYNDNLTQIEGTPGRRQFCKPSTSTFIPERFKSPVNNEDVLEKNRKTLRTPLLDTTNCSIAHDDNISQTESTPRRKQSYQPSRLYTSTTEPNRETDIDLKQEILRKLNKLIIDVAVIKETVRALKSDKNVNIKSNIDLEVIKDLPLATFEQLQQIEVKLRDETFFQELVKMLSGVGGHDVNNITTNVLKRLLSNELAETYSLMGKKNKKSFSDLKLMKVVIGVVRVHNKDAMEITITQSIGRWLVQAKQRHDRETQKVQKHQAGSPLERL